MKACLFAGPSLYDATAPPGLQRFGPAALGSVFRAVEAGYRRIGIIDGYFGNVPAVWHKEILFAISQGVEVVGAASMGALRAAELSVYGMVGIGRVYRLYRGGCLTDDDEVAVIHAPAYLGFRPLSHAMVNIRYTLRHLLRAGIIERTVAEDLARLMKTRHFSQRTDQALAHELAFIGETTHIDAHLLLQQFALEYIDAKHRDARALLDYLARDSRAVRISPSWQFPSTAHWRRQFIHDLADVPPLGEPT